MASLHTLFVQKDSLLHRSHPFTKLGYIVLAGVCGYCLPGSWSGPAAFLVFNLGLAGVCGILARAWKILWRTLLPLVLFMVMIHGLLNPDNATPVLDIYGIAFYREGLAFAGVTLLRLAVILSASLLFVLTTRPQDLITALSQRTGSPGLAYLMGSPLLLLPLMQQRIKTIQAAQMSRGMDIQGSVFKRIRALVPLLIPLVIGAFIDIEQRATALELKGFSSKGPKTSLNIVADSSGQKRLRRMMLILSALILIAGIAGV